MKLYAPSYYKKFKCIADKCRHSCCVGWEIDIDPETLCAYQTLDHPYAETIRRSISCDETPHFRLCAHERCPHLRENGLCEIILQLGESHLCEICREHPRFYHETARGKEVGVGMSCEEACRIILNADDYRTFTEVEDLSDTEAPPSFDTHPLRERVYNTLSRRELPYAERLKQIKADFGIHLAKDKKAHEAIASLEYLDDTHRSLFACYTSDAALPKCCEREAERALAYFVFRHCSGTQNEKEFRNALRFCLFCERLLASMAQESHAETLTELARILSEEIEYSEDNTELLTELF